MAERKLTDLEIERHLAGDLPEARFAEASDADRARLAELRTESEAFLRSVDVDMEVKRIQQRVERAKPEKRAWWRWVFPTSALAAAAAILLVFLRRGDHPGTQDDDIQLKGGEVTLIVHKAVAGSTSQELESGDTVSAGDRLRFEIDAPKPGYYAVVGIDGSGNLTVYYPDGATAAKYTPEDRLVPGAIQLDATPGDEHFIVVYALKSFSTSILKKPLPANLSQAEVVLHKK